MTTEDLLEPDSSDSEHSSVVDPPPYSPISLPPSPVADDEEGGNEGQVEEDGTAHTQMSVSVDYDSAN